ncbi:MAG: rRNA maturation RNase YbeY [bacterium]
MSFDVPADLNAEEARRAAEAALAHGGRSDGQLAIIFVSDETLAGLHGRFLGDPSRTDVMAFDLSDEEGAEFEVYISVDRAREVSASRSVSLQRELALYLVHGTLHLCGHDDHDEDARASMRRAETTIMDSLGYPRDDAPHEYASE